MKCNDFTYNFKNNLHISFMCIIYNFLYTIHFILNKQYVSMKSILKVGGNHIGIDNNDYRSRPGGPFVGKLFYVSLTFDEFLN